jgi:putative two-component system response regulator
MRDGKARVLTVDDDTTSREIVHAILQNQGYEALEAESGEAALDLIQVELPDLVLLDVEMGGISGFEIVKRLKQDSRTRSIPVIMVTGLGDRESRLRGLENGAEDYLMKPVDPTELRMRVRNHLRLKEYGDLLANLNHILEERVQEKTAQLLESYRQTIYLLTSAAEYRDQATGAHVKRISYFTSALSRAIGMDSEFVESIFYASPMHDIGKIGMPDSILLKPGPLTAPEWEIMRTHPSLGRNMLREGSSPYIQMGALIAQTHHECWDGSGYPAGLKGEQIPMAGRIMMLCDQYDALRSRRPYKDALDHEKVVKTITEGDGRTSPAQFCPSVLKTFESCANDFKDIFLQNQ